MESSEIEVIDLSDNDEQDENDAANVADERQIDISENPFKQAQMDAADVDQIQDGLNDAADVEDQEPDDLDVDQVQDEHIDAAAVADIENHDLIDLTKDHAQDDQIDITGVENLNRIDLIEDQAEDEHTDAVDVKEQNPISINEDQAQENDINATNTGNQNQIEATILPNNEPDDSLEMEYDNGNAGHTREHQSLPVKVTEANSADEDIEIVYSRTISYCTPAFSSLSPTEPETSTIPFALGDTIVGDRGMPQEVVDVQFIPVSVKSSNSTEFNAEKESSEQNSLEEILISDVRSLSANILTPGKQSTKEQKQRRKSRKLRSKSRKSRFKSVKPNIKNSYRQRSIQSVKISQVRILLKNIGTSCNVPLCNKVKKKFSNKRKTESRAKVNQEVIDIDSEPEMIDLDIEESRKFTLSVDEVPCQLCGQTKTMDILESGKLYRNCDLSIHYFCLLFSNQGHQKGEDSEGLFGFLIQNINHVVNSGNNLICNICNNKGGTVLCSRKGCRSRFHFPCGYLNNFLFKFTGAFKAYCAKHDTRSKAVTSSRPCSICLEKIGGERGLGVQIICCDNPLHHSCLQRMAISSGQHHFRCPLCNNKDKFQKRCIEAGVYIPIKDADWEDLDFYDFREASKPTLSCIAAVCQSMEGRLSCHVGTDWELITCDFCGGNPVHVNCGRLDIHAPDYICVDCDLNTGDA